MSEPITERSLLEEVNLLVHIWGFYIGKPAYKEPKVQGTGSCTYFKNPSNLITFKRIKTTK